MWPLLAPFIDELGAAVIGRLFLWRGKAQQRRRLMAPPELPEFRGDLQSFYVTNGSEIEWEWAKQPRQLQNDIQLADGHFMSLVATPFPENGRVHVRRWWRHEGGLSVIGLGGLVQLGYYWFDRLALSLAARGIEFWMMDEPFNHFRTPKGFRPGELIAGGGPEQLIAAVRQAVIDTRLLIAYLRSRGQRVGLVGQSYGGWLCLLIAILEPDLEFAVPLIPMCDLPAWYQAGLPLSRGARRRFPRLEREQLAELLRPINPVAWKPQLNGDRIDLHAARFDRIVPYKSIEQLARSWGTRFTHHHAGHYSVFFGDRLREHVVSFVTECPSRPKEVVSRTS